MQRHGSQPYRSLHQEKHPTLAFCLGKMPILACPIRRFCVQNSNSLVPWPRQCLVTELASACCLLVLCHRTQLYASKPQAKCGLWPLVSTHSLSFTHLLQILI